MRQVNVLLIDADADRQELRNLLVVAGHTIVGETDNPAKILTLARALRPDVVFCEVALAPAIFDAVESLVAEWIAPVVLVTGDGSAAASAVERAGRAGAMGFLAKPLRPADMEPLIPIVLARWQQLKGLDGEVKSLNERMEARKIIGRAKAILMERLQLPERDAFKRIQAQSATMNKPVHEIARAIIMAHDISG